MSDEKTHLPTRKGRNGGTLIPFDSERARAAVKKRYERANKAIREGIASAGEELPGISTRDPYKVIQEIARAHAMQAHDAGARGAGTSFQILVSRGFPQPEREKGVIVSAPVEDADLKELLAQFRIWKAQKAKEITDSDSDSQ
jgi:hypothetical protein